MLIVTAYKADHFRHLSQRLAPPLMTLQTDGGLNAMGLSKRELADLGFPRLSPITLQNCTSRGKSDLVRGVDFFVRRTSPYRRQLMFTERGPQRLQLRAYRVFGETLAPSRRTIWNGQEQVRPIEGSAQERRMRLKQAIAVGMREYPKTPCVVPNCPCIIHRVGVPQVDVVADVMRGFGPSTRY